MKPFKGARTIMDAVPAARDDLTQIRDDISRATDAIIILALVVSVALLLNALREG